MESANMRVVVLMLSLVGYVVAVGPSYDDVCKIGRPDPDVPHCGRGGQDCKEGYYCKIAEDDRYAKCCLKEKENCYPLKRKRICATSTTTAEPECPSGQEYNECGTACPPTCEDPAPVCTRQCVPGCFCPNGKVLHEGECIDPDDCTCLDGKVYKDCGSFCPPTCDVPAPVCIEVCVKGCFCPEGKVLNNNTCINPSQCPPQCPDDEVYNECGSSCPPTCEDPPSFCTADCNPGCFCSGDKVRHGGECISREDCPP